MHMTLLLLFRKKRYWCSAKLIRHLTGPPLQPSLICGSMPDILLNKRQGLPDTDSALNQIFVARQSLSSVAALCQRGFTGARYEYARSLAESHCNGWQSFCAPSFDGLRNGCPGQTLDALVTIPVQATNGTKFAVYDANLMLRNTGGSAASLAGCSPSSTLAQRRRLGQIQPVHCFRRSLSRQSEHRSGSCYAVFQRQ